MPFISVSFSLLTIFTGVIVMIGWYTNNVLLMQIKASYIAMTTNTALLFIFSGIALLALNRNWKYISFSCAVLIGLFSTVILSQYIFNINLGIDQLLIEPYNTTATQYPGRLAPETCLAFILFSLTLITLQGYQRFKISLLFPIFLNLFVFIIGFATFLGYLIGITVVYRYLGMALPTVLGLIFLSIGTRAYIEYVARTKNLNVFRYYSLEGGIAFFVTTILLLSGILSTEQKYIHEKIDTDAKIIRIFVEDKINTTLSALQKINQKVATVSSISPQSLLNTIEIVLESFPRFEDIAWIKSKEGTLDITLHSFLSKENLQEIKNRLDVLSASATTLSNAPQFLGSLKISQEEQALLIGMPITIENKNQGFVIATFTLKQLYSNLLEKNYNDYDVALYEGKNLIYSNFESGQTSALEKRSFKLALHDPNLSFFLEIGKRQHRVSIFATPLTKITILFGLMISCFVSWALYLLYIIIAKTRSLESIQKNLMLAQKVAKMGSWTWDLTTNTIWCSEEVRSILKLEVNSQLKTPSDLFLKIAPSDQNNLHRSLTALRSGKPILSEIYSLKNNGDLSRYILLEAGVVKSINHVPLEISGIVQDVTERKELEQNYLQLQKMDLLGQLTGGIAHDFNNILMVIQGNLDLLQTEFAEGSFEKQRLKAAANAVTRGASLTRGLLTFAKKQPIKPSILNIKTFFSNITLLLKPVLGVNIEIRSMIEDDVWKIWVDPSLLETAIINLALNARDAMDNKGTLTFQVSNIVIKEDRGNNGFRVQKGEYVTISVIDTGKGIPQEMISKIFEPFFTTKEVGKGTGLGLSMVYGFVQQSQGVIHVESTVGEGTTVTLYFHKMESNMETAEEEDAIDFSNFKGHETILIVEDEENVRVVAVHLLKKHGYKVLEAQSGEEALSIMKKTPNIDLLFTDIVMPGELNGVDLADKATKLLPSLKIIFTTGFPKAALLNGRNEVVIAKPYKFSTLLASIRDIFTKS